MNTNSAQIGLQVHDFWQDVESATNERQRHMFQCINQHLRALSSQIEATVGRVLDVRLEPVTIVMDPPAAQDFHESLQNLFALGTTLCVISHLPESVVTAMVFTACDACLFPHNKLSPVRAHLPCFGNLQCTLGSWRGHLRRVCRHQGAVRAAYPGEGA